MIFFTSDSHLNHRGILKHTNRPWSNVRAMNEGLVAAWNGAVLRENDTVYHLGDFGMHAPNDGEGEDLGVLFWRLRGRKHLVVGNHDAKNPQVLRLPWESIGQIVEVKKDGRRLVLCHYALESWAGMHHGAAHLHGHSHGTLRKAPRRIDVGVDCFPAPVSWDEVWAQVDRETFVPVDHHGRA